MRIFTPKPLPDTLVHPVFYFNYPPESKGGGLFRDVEQTFFKEVVVEDPESADCIVLANNFYKEPSELARAYIQQYAELAEKLNKKLYIFSCGDFTDHITFDPRVHVFRYSLYRTTASPQDISIPTVTEDPPPELLYMQKKRPKPLVAFCGMGGFRSAREWLGYYVKIVLNNLKSLYNPAAHAHKIGVYWRRKMMRACGASPAVDTNFIVRGSFSGHKASIELDPAEARKEYLETTANADFVLAPKGDGNYSNRFLKTLAFGRIPVLVDTDVVLPFEDIIDYTKIIIRVPMNQVHKTPELVRAFYEALSEEEWQERQRLARETFEKYLRQDSFFRTYFSLRHTQK